MFIWKVVGGRASETTSIRRRDAAAAWVTPVSGQITANSSPPILNGMSAPRECSSSSLPTQLSTVSPTSCPKVSLIFLK